MNQILNLAASALLIVVTCAAGADKSKLDLPSYPHQRTINAALRQLTEAQKLIKAGGSGIAEAIVCLKKAEGQLSKDKGNQHGSFKETACRLSGQAAKSLEKGLADKASHEIEEAIEAAHKAAKAKAD